MPTEKLPTTIRKEQIVEAALELLGRNGLKKLRMTDIAKHLQLVPSALYRHFKNRDAMLSAVFDHITQLSELRLKL